MNMLRASGRMGITFGRDSIEQYFLARIDHWLAVERYPALQANTREFYDGYAAGVNRYVSLRPAEFPIEMPADFSGYDARHRDGRSRVQLVRRFPHD